MAATLNGIGIDDIWQSFTAGVGAAALSKTVVAPFDRVKLVLQTQGCNYGLNKGEVERFTGPVNCMTRIAKEEGVTALWRGNQVDVLRYAPVHAFNFAFRDFFSLFNPNFSRETDPLKRIACNILEGGMAGTASLALLLPFDVMRTRLAADMGTGYTRQYRGLVDCFAKTLKLGGVLGGVYSGFYISIPAIFLYRSVYLGGWEVVKDFVGPSTYTAKFICAQAVTSLAGLLSYPFDTVRRRVMLQSGSRERMYLGGRDCIRRMLVDEGISAFYRGATFNILRGAGGALTLLLYDEFKAKMA